ncbi:MAG: hypothetical protein JNK89_01935, partial [Saprospiraceae bacterium]|nr:hypothetical protein [Saprospiraceae bacterium]
MNIAPDLLLEYGAEKKFIPRREDVFREGQHARCYFQIGEGLVKMVNHGPENDFIQGIFTEGESFG